MITCRHAGSLFFTGLRIYMVQTWSNWKQFPDAQSGEHVEPPIGPGVYEDRHTMTGSVVAFGHSANVANSLADLKLTDGISAFSWLFRKPPLVSHISSTARARRRAAPRPRLRRNVFSACARLHGGAAWTQAGPRAPTDLAIR